MIKYISIFWLVLRCLLVARKENSTGFSTGLTGRSKNLDPTGNPTGRSTRPVPVDTTGFHLWGEVPSLKTYLPHPLLNSTLPLSNFIALPLNFKVLLEAFFYLIAQVFIHFFKTKHQ